MASAVRIYTTGYCSFCKMAKGLLARKKVPYDEIDVTHDPEMRDWLVRETGRRTVPQIFIGERSIGGYDELRALDAKGELDSLLAAS
jgi:glutaredoxin 3